MREDSFEGCLMAATLLIILAGWSLWGAYQYGVGECRQEAVESGHAEWVATPNGKVEFQWKGVE